MNNQKLMLIDGNSVLNRAFFALPPLNDKDGKNVNAVYGFVNILLKIISTYQPDKLIVAFDKHGHNFRKDIYADYKATRKKMSDDLAAQVPVLHDLLKLMQVQIVEKAGVEADDILGTISRAFDGHSYIVSGDKDMLQLITDKTTVLLTKRGVTDVDSVDIDNISEKFGMRPSQVIDYKALCGDTSDNIPGVKGVGEKTALGLLQKYDTLDNVYDHLSEQKGALLTKLTEGRDDAYMSRKLATIVTDADIQFDLTYDKLYVADQAVLKRMEDLQFKSIIGRLQFSEDNPVSKVEVATVEVTTAEGLEQAIGSLDGADYIAFHIDGNCVYLAASEETQYAVRMSDSFLDELTEEHVLERLKPLLEGSTPKAVYDWKTLRHRLENYDVDIAAVRYDIAIMQYLVEYRSHKDLQSLCHAFDYDDFGAGIYGIAKKLNGKLAENGVEKLYFDVELPLCDLLYRMETEGVAVDLDLLQKMSVEMRKQADDLAEKIYELAGERFNINSPMQLAKILYEKLGLPQGKKTHRGYATTNSDAMEFLLDKHPIATVILDYRKVAKLLSSYVDGLRPLVQNGLVHTTYNQTLTSTGRLSSSDPNLQNIPVRDELGKEIRRMFVSKHGVFVGADYSQIELRLLAAFSGDENLLGSFRRGDDIHRMVASELLGIPQELITHDQRRMAKAVNFGIIYGISDFGLSRDTGLTVKKAHEYIDLYFKRFPKIQQYLDGSVKQARETGYVYTITGRRRQIPEINSSNYNLRNFGERAAMNMPLQGSAADIMKIAMLRVDEAMRKQNLRSKIVMQIHDELIVDCYPEEAETVKVILKREMESAVDMACPLTADTEEGKTLYEA
mgnify:FL=1